MLPSRPRPTAHAGAQSRRKLSDQFSPRPLGAPLPELLSCSVMTFSWMDLLTHKGPTAQLSGHRSRAAWAVFFGGPYILCQLLQLFCKNYSCMHLRQLDGAGWVCQPQARGGGLSRVWPNGLRCGNVGGDATSAVPDRSEIGPYPRGVSAKQRGSYHPLANLRQALEIGVGMAVVGHPSLRTGRADFPHPALQSVSHPLAAGLVRSARAKAYREISP